MSTSKEVFALRKSGQLDEAYRIAVQLNNVPNPDVWDMRALAWCLADIVAREIPANNYQNLKTYAQQLERIKNSRDEAGCPALTQSEDAALIARLKRAFSLVGRAQAEQQRGNSGAMITYKEIYAKRKENINEAYKIALQATATSNPDEMELHALAWCLIDLIKRDFTSNNYQNLEIYRQQLQKINVDTHRNDVLAKQQAYALSMCEPLAPIIFQAQTYSKQGNYEEAIKCYSSIYQNMPQEYHTGFGWDLYRHSKHLLTLGKYTIPQIKRNLHLYLNLHTEKPSTLHSTVLWFAKELSKDNDLDLCAFSRMWDLDMLRDEDFERTTSNDKQYPALAEDVIQRVSKIAAKSKNTEQMRYVFPFLEEAIQRYPDNFWLVYYKAKALLLLGNTEEAQKYCRTVCKNKRNEFWAWDLLGDAYSSAPETALSCYSKALLCPAEEVMTVQVRRKTAQLLAELGHYPQAKFEVTAHEKLNPNKQTKEITGLLSQDWFSKTALPSSNKNFYAMRVGVAEELLLADLPWVNAVSGEVFTVPGKEGKPDRLRRKIYMQHTPFVQEESCAENVLPSPNMPPGSPLRVKGEILQGKSYQILTVEQRKHGVDWDILSSHIGIITFVNAPKRVYHVLVERGVESFFHADKLGKQVSEGDFIELKIAQYYDKEGKKYRVLDVKPTNRQPSENIYKKFNLNEVRISGEIGFAGQDIFIPPHLVRIHNLTDGETISGNAMLNYNKKKSEWSWKAITIEKPFG